MRKNLPIVILEKILAGYLGFSLIFPHQNCTIYIYVTIGHSNRDPATSSKRWRSNLSKSVWLRQLCSKTLQAPSFGGGFVIPITVPYCSLHQRLMSTPSVYLSYNIRYLKKLFIYHLYYTNA